MDMLMMIISVLRGVICESFLLNAETNQYKENSSENKKSSYNTHIDRENCLVKLWVNGELKCLYIDDDNEAFTVYQYLLNVFEHFKTLF